MNSVNTSKRKSRIWLPVIIIVLLWLIYYPFVYRQINNYKNYIINRKYAVDYVNKTYGENFEVKDLSIRSLEVPIFTTASSGYYDYDTFKIIDKNEIEPDFRIKIFKSKISQDYYYYDRDLFFYKNHINEYMQKYISEDQYVLKILLNCVPNNKYDNYQEMISDKMNINCLEVNINILIYGDADPEKYNWVYDLYEDLGIVKYRELSLSLNFSDTKKSTVGLYSDQYKKISVYGNSEYQTLDEFFGKKQTDNT